MGRSFRSIDWHVILTLFAIGIFGLSILLTIDQSYFWQQFAFFGIGLGLFILFSSIEPFLWQWFAPFGYIVSCLLLLSSYLGPNIRGATRWLIIGTTQIQPSEIVKPILILSFTFFLIKFPPKTIKTLCFHALLFLIPFLMVLRQPDLGSSIVYGITCFAMLFAAGAPIILFILIPGALAILSPLLWHALATYQQQRILTFLFPGTDPGGAGYNALQSMIAVGSGQLTGRGLGMGTQSHLRFLPEFHTDFIFATLVEELGFLGGAFLLLLYAYLLWRLLYPFVKHQSSDIFLFLYSVGMFAMILAQICINSGMNIGIIPITGITLPLVSYGGSSVLSVMSSFGILTALRKSEDKTSLQESR